MEPNQHHRIFELAFWILISTCQVEGWKKNVESHKVDLEKKVRALKGVAAFPSAVVSTHKRLPFSPANLINNVVKIHQAININILTY